MNMSVYLTSDSQPVAEGLFTFMDAALVESFVRLRSTANDHLSCGVDADGEAVFKEIKPEAGGVRLGSAAQSHSSSLQHREARALQEHKAIWRRRRNSF